MTEGVTRRDFLKSAALVVTAAVLPGCAESSSFKEIKDGDKLTLNVGEKGNEEISIRYANSGIDHISMRQKAGKEDKLPFKDGENTERLLGEALELNCYRAIKNPGLGKEITIGIYPKLTGFLRSMEGREDLNLDRSNLFVLPVIVAHQNYTGVEAPSETNKKGGNQRLTKFGKGGAVGVYDDTKKELKIIGYLGDISALALK